ncbi:hypothetical protein HNR12_002198 [Streptomonospora nanhaiensis]|uniref:Uncharacterized protein n=1 Tax=Streptomonospora nanhaiensis TaxID=1323731 RepID=A0A853BN21_9ACTN|nr:hypothetical protein [Streptomonospora nanhaiensis]
MRLTADAGMTREEEREMYEREVREQNGAPPTK